MQNIFRENNIKFNISHLSIIAHDIQRMIDFRLHDQYQSEF